MKDLLLPFLNVLVGFIITKVKFVRCMLASSIVNVTINKKDKMYGLHLLKNGIGISKQLPGGLNLIILKLI